MDPDQDSETYNPWTVVHLVFEHLSAEGLHPTLGDGGDPSVHAAQLLRALAIEPAAEGNREVVRAVRDHLADLRSAVFEDPAEAAHASRPSSSRPPVST